MTYELALSYLASLNESRIKPGLERIKEVLTALGSPHLKYPHILVGGTNGKGSVVSFLGAVLSTAGYRTGLFTSPHLHKFEERIIVDGQKPTREEITELVNIVQGTGAGVTYFECVTAMALCHFARCNVDVAILEVGIGGAWDATNATDPILSIITSVELDHQDWLGHDIGKIAREKGGIIRNQRPVVVGPVGTKAGEILINQAKAVGAEVILYGRDFHARHDTTGTSLHFEGRMWSIEELAPGLKGRFQLDNAACALAALERLVAAGMKISSQDAEKGIESARWPGRLQEMGGFPPIIVDAAHNPAAVKALIASLEEKKNIVWLISALSDKNLKGMAAEMARISSRFVLVPLDHPRALNILELEKKVPGNAHVLKASNIEQGIKEARKLAGENGCVVVAGSVVLAGEVLEVLSTQYPVPSTQESGARSQD